MNKNTFSALLSLSVALVIMFITMSCLNIQNKSTDSDKNKKNLKKTAQFANVSDTGSTQSDILADNATASSQNSDLSSKTSSPDGNQAGNFKIEFGFNIGFLMDYQNNNQIFSKPLQQIKKDGITDLRIYEPFTTNIVKHPGTATNLLDNLTKSGFNVLLTFSNYPTIPSIQYKKDAADVKDLDTKEDFTNRYPPVNLNAYDSYLSDFLNSLKQKNDLQNMSFEIGNEPDSKKFFWGQSQDFVDIAKSTYSVLQNYGRPVYCCGFTSEFANNAKTNPDLTKLISSNFMDKVNLSFHFYQNKKFDINSLRLPHLNNSIITEFNFYAYQKESSTTRIAFSNSPAFGSLLIQTLIFAYKNDIKKIYFFKLVDLPSKEGTLGFFDQNGSPKPPYTYLVKIYDVIKDGYTIKENSQEVRLIGAQKTILYSKVDNNAGPTNVQHNNGRNGLKKMNNNNGNFQAGTWSIVNN